MGLIVTSPALMGPCGPSECGLERGLGDPIWSKVFGIMDGKKPG